VTCYIREQNVQTEEKMNTSVTGNEVELVARKAGFTVVPCFIGHGIGSYFHGPPDIYHCCKCQHAERVRGG
jgi:methionine aminopeptidase